MPIRFKNMTYVKGIFFYFLGSISMIFVPEKNSFLKKKKIRLRHFFFFFFFFLFVCLFVIKKSNYKRVHFETFQHFLK